MKPSAKRIASKWLTRTGGPLWVPMEEGPPDQEVKYIGAFLSDKSWHRLLRWFQRVSGERLLPQRPDDPHVTIKYAPTFRDVMRTPRGALLTLSVVGWASDDKGQAVEVKLQDARSASPVPHITLATAPGVKAVYSNDLLKRGKQGDPDVHYEQARGPSMVGVVRFVLR